MLKFYIFTISLIIILLAVLYVMNKVWKRYTLEELLKKNDLEFYNEICKVAKSNGLTVAGITLAHYALVKDDSEKFSSPKRTCENYITFFTSYYKDPKKGILETEIQNSTDLWKVIEALQQEGLIDVKHKPQDYQNAFTEQELFRV